MRNHRSDETMVARSSASSHTIDIDGQERGNTTTIIHDNKQASHFDLIFSHSYINDAVRHHPYSGSGTPEDPYAVEFIHDDPRNPMRFSAFKRWSLCAIVGFATLAVSFNSSAFSGGVEQVIEQFQCTEEVATLGISLFVLGFAIGPLFWGPMSELYGRQILFFSTYGVLTFFMAGSAGSQNIQTLLILRFFAGAFGSSPLTNAGGVVADIFPAKERGLAMAIFAVSPFMGPVIGPIVGGFVGQSIGWRWLQGILALFSLSVWILGALVVPETYAPVILRARAAALSKATGKSYVSKLELNKQQKEKEKRDPNAPVQAKPSPVQLFKTALSRPWVLLFREPVVMVTTIYMAIIYGTLYMEFSAFPIVYQEARGWSQGIGGLAFIGLAVGFLLAIAYVIPDNRRYARIEREAKERGEKFAPPESRLPPALLGCVLLPVGLFWFAWTNGPEIHWAVSIVAGVPFGMGMVLVFLSIFNYLLDTYTVYAASVLAANSVLRSLFGFAFPLFTNYMYASLGIHWASSVPAFLALACVPAPFLFYKYGPRFRRGQKYSRQAEQIMLEILSEEEGKEGKGKESQEEETRGRERREDGGVEKPERVLGSRRSEGGLIGADEEVDLEMGLRD